MAPRGDNIATAVALARGRAFLYAFFSDQMLAPPINDKQSISSLQRIWKEVDELLGPEPTCEVLRYLASDVFSEDALAREFSDLFRVPGGRYLAPIESVYEGIAASSANTTLGQLRGRAWSAVTEWYQRTGYEVPRHQRFEADHLGCELEFLKVLCEIEAAAWADQDAEKAGATRSEQVEFLELHLLSWLPALQQRLAVVARLPYYSGLFETLAAFLQMERTSLTGDRS